MTYSEEDAIRKRIIAALGDAFPDRASDMGDQVTRWFTRHWRNSPADPIPEDQRCRLCDIARRTHSVRTADVPRSVALCSDCVRDACRMAADDRYPARDMVRMEALRALRAEGLEESARFVEELASAFPDLARDEGPCGMCGHVKPLVRGAKTKLCLACLQSLKRAFGLENQS